MKHRSDFSLFPNCFRVPINLVRKILLVKVGKFDKFDAFLFSNMTSLSASFPIMPKKFLSLPALWTISLKLDQCFSKEHP